MMLKYCHLSSVCKVLEQVTQLFLHYYIALGAKPRRLYFIFSHILQPYLTTEDVERKSFGKCSFNNY